MDITCCYRVLRWQNLQPVTEPAWPAHKKLKCLLSILCRKDLQIDGKVELDRKMGFRDAEKVGHHDMSSGARPHISHASLSLLGSWPQNSSSCSPSLACLVFSIFCKSVVLNLPNAAILHCSSLCLGDPLPSHKIILVATL